MIVEFEGVKHEFPDNTKAEDVAKALAHHATAKSPLSEEAQQQVAAGSFIRGIPILGAYEPQAAAAVRSVAHPVTGAGEAGDTYGERYKKNLEKYRAEIKQFEEENPKTEMAGEMIGGLISTAGVGATATGAKLLGMTGRTLPAMMRSGALSGGVIGAADAAARGNDPLTAGGLGAAIGAGAPGVGRLVSLAARPLMSAIRGVRDPGGEAARRVGGAVARDMDAGTAGLTPQEFVEAQRSGQPVNLMDVGGETTRAIARSAANTSPEGRDVLNRSINARYEAQGDRLTDWLRKTFNYPDATAQTEALDKIAKTVNRPAYAKAYSDPNAQGLWHEGFEQLMQSPDMQEAAKAAGRTGANKAAGQGFTPPRNPFVWEESGRFTLAPGKDGTRALPNLQFWDAVKQNLDDRIGAAMRTGEKGHAGDLLSLKSQLTSYLDDRVPAYAQARSGASMFFGAKDAIEAGQVAVTSKMKNAEIRAGLAKMSPLEKQLFQDGFVDRYIQSIRENPDRRSVLNQIATSDAARERLALALGTQRATELETFLRVEGIMDLARGAVQGNSTTARQLVELGLAGGVDLYQGGGSFTGDPKALMNAALVYGALRGQRTIDNRVAQQVAKLLTSGDMTQLTKGIRILAGNRTLLTAIRDADAGLAAIGLRGAAPPAARALGLQSERPGIAANPDLVPAQPEQPQRNQPVPQPRAGQGQ